MKNTNISASTRRNGRQFGNQNTTPSTTQDAMQHTTKCMTQSTFQKKILNLLRRAGDKVAEVMNIIVEVGAITGINVHFERIDLAERSEQDDYRHGNSRHSDGNWGNRTDALDELDERDKFDEADDIDELDEIKEVTIPELAEMISEKTCFRPECTLYVLNIAFDLMDEQN